MTIYTGPSGRLLRGPGGKIAIDKACCCKKEHCPGCCLPTGPVPGNPCNRLCPGDAGMPQLYLDVTITGTGFGNLSFVNAPITPATASGAAFCIGLYGRRDVSLGGGPEFIGNGLAPHDFHDTRWDCDASNALLEANGCFIADNLGCAWVLTFGSQCQRDVSGNFTGHYQVAFSYLYDDTFLYNYPSLVIDPTTVAKCWSRDTDVDIAFSMTKASTNSFCPHLTGADKTFVFRVHTLAPPPRAFMDPIGIINPFLSL